MRKGMEHDAHFYDRKFPEVNELVTVEHRRYSDHGAGVECELLEYGRLVALLPYVEISKRKNHPVSREIKLGKNRSCIVIRVDEEKGYVDLSMKDVNSDNNVACGIKYKNAKLVYDVFHTIVNYEEFIHPLYAEGIDVYDKLRFNPESFGLEGTQFESLMKFHTKHFVPIVYKVIGQFKVNSNNGELDPIKQAINSGLSEKNKIKINLIASPEFLISTEDVDGDTALLVVEDALYRIKNSCAKLNCAYQMTKIPIIQS